jgi:hypothetical protein
MESKGMIWICKSRILERCHRRVPEKNENSSSRRLSSEEEQVTEHIEKRKNMGDRRENVFVRRSDDETGVIQRSQTIAILVMVSSSRSSKSMEFANRDFNATINIR